MKRIFRTHYFRVWRSPFGNVDICWVETSKRHPFGLCGFHRYHIGLHENFYLLDCTGLRKFRRFLALAPTTLETFGKNDDSRVHYPVIYDLATDSADRSVVYNWGYNTV